MDINQPKDTGESKVQLEKKITYGNILETAVIGVAIVAAFVSVQVRMNSLERDLGKVERLQVEIVELERRLGSQYVRNEVFAEIKIQLTDIKTELKTLNSKR
jgi:hypothetical protein